jgi:predicted RNA-binding Zn-ribbon protein involved in translation (DUF1610 family)
MEFVIDQLKTEAINTLSPSVQQFCPECGAAMIEADSIYENGAIYIWYKCSKNDCNGSWLQKFKKN